MGFFNGFEVIAHTVNVDVRERWFSLKCIYDRSPSTVIQEIFKIGVLVMDHSLIRSCVHLHDLHIRLPRTARALRCAHSLLSSWDSGIILSGFQSVLIPTSLWGEDVASIYEEIFIMNDDVANEKNMPTP